MVQELQIGGTRVPYGMAASNRECLPNADCFT